MLAAEAGEKEVSGPLRNASGGVEGCARRRYADVRVGEQRIAIVGKSRCPNHDRPPVIAAGNDDVHLVVVPESEFSRRSVLGREERPGLRFEGETLRVAIAVT